MEDHSKKPVKEIIQRITIIAITLTVLIAATFAWFATNRTVTAAGTIIASDLPEQMVIAKTEEEIVNIDNVYGHTSVSYGKDAEEKEIKKALTQCFHNPSCNIGNTCTPDTNSYLQYYSSYSNVDINTGNFTSTASTQTVARSKEGSYFLDYDVYIASLVREMEVSELQVSIGTSSRGAKKSSIKAMTVDCYCDNVYKGKLNIGETGKTLTLLKNSDGSKIKIPYNKGEGIKYLKIKFRQYYDGSAVGSDGKAYINNSAKVNTSYYPLTITVTAIK